MREALIVLLESPTGRAVVLAEGAPVGTLTLADVHRGMLSEEPAA
jgi:hypothetical protein